jgi:hypothetical protein
MRRYPGRVKTRTLVASVTAFWTVSGVAAASQVRTMNPSISWARALSTSLASSLMWVPLTIAIVAVVRRAPLESGRAKRTALVILLAFARPSGFLSQKRSSKKSPSVASEERTKVRLRRAGDHAGWYSPSVVLMQGPRFTAGAHLPATRTLA